MTKDLTPAERSQSAENADQVVFQHKGRDYPMSGADYGHLLDRVAAKVKGGTSLNVAEKALVAKAGWDAPATGSHAPLTAADDLMARAGWAD